MSKKTSTELKYKYIEQTYQLFDEYEKLVAEGSEIFNNLPDDADSPPRIEAIGKRLEAIKNTMQSNALILADMLSEVLNENETS